MALSCYGLCSQLSLIQLCAFCTNRMTRGFYSRNVSYQPRLYCRHYSSSKVRHGVIGQYVASRLQWANMRVSSKGSKLLFRGASDVRWIKVKMATQGMNFQDLPYREMEKLRQVQCGAEVCEILAVRDLFSEAPLGIHKRRISPLLFLTPYLPGFLIGRRLNSHALELLQLDRALSKLGLHQLSDSELKQACYLRGFCSEDLDIKREWLTQWLQGFLLVESQRCHFLCTALQFSQQTTQRLPTATDRKS